MFLKAKLKVIFTKNCGIPNKNDYFEAFKQANNIFKKYVQYFSMILYKNTESFQVQKFSTLAKILPKEKQVKSIVFCLNSERCLDGFAIVFHFILKIFFLS